MKTDVQIAQEAKLLPISEIAEKRGISEEEMTMYGTDKAKIDLSVIENRADEEDGKLILVTAMNPTPAGEGKTTCNIGLTDALNRLGKKATCAIREPSLGPSFGIKGGAAGGGYSQVVPMADINLHFTGDMHAITASHNLIAALLDNHLQQGNELGIDPRKIIYKRVVDLNDRALRNVTIGLGGEKQGVPRETGFDITVASEIMAILCLSKDIEDLKERVSNILIGYTYDDKPVFVRDINAQGSVALLMKDAIRPNMVQTLENNPAFVHGGPFANIAHGCNSMIATKLALKTSDYVVTEAGFGADLGAEKFFNIKCRFGDLKPSVAVIVATVRALKYTGGVLMSALGEENLDAVREGFDNLKQHIENVNKFGVPAVVAINRFPTDTDAEIALVQELAEECGSIAIPTEVWAKGGEGGEELAKAVIKTIEEKESNFEVLYDVNLSIKEKIEIIAKEIYRADGVHYTDNAEKSIERMEANGLDKVPVCMAKTQYSFSDDPNLKNAPKGFEITIRDIKSSNGAGFLVALTGDVMTMPGLPKEPAANKIDIKPDGEIVGLF